MIDEASETIMILTYEDENLSRGPQDLITVALDVPLLRTRLRSFLQNLHSIADWDRDPDTSFQLQEIEFTVEITAEGDFKLLGVGTSASAKGAVTFILKRPEKKTPS